MTITIGDCLFGIPMGAVSPSSSSGGGGYILPPATTSTLGGVIVGDNLEVEDTGEVSATVQLKNAADNGYGVEISYMTGAGVGYGGWSSTILLDSEWSAARESWSAPHIDLSNALAGPPYTHNNYGRITGFNDGILFGPGGVSPLHSSLDDMYVGVVKISTASGETEAEGTKSITLETRRTFYAQEGDEYEVVDSQLVLTDKTGILYRALTDAEYTALETKSENTMYRITDTGKVYLGETDISGGSAAVMTTQAGLGLGAENTGYVGTTTVTVTNPDEEVV